MCCELWKIKEFEKFAVGNFRKIKERHLVHGDIQIFVEFLSISLEKNLLVQRACLKKLVDSTLLSSF